MSIINGNLCLDANQHLTSEVTSEEDNAINRLRWFCYDLGMDFNTIRVKYFDYRINGRLAGGGLSVSGAYLRTLLFMQGKVKNNGYISVWKKENLDDKKKN